MQTITKAVTELNALLAKNPKVGRAALHRLFKGSLRRRPGETGYRLQGDSMPLMVVAENATADPEQLGSAIYASSSGD